MSKIEYRILNYLDENLTGPERGSNSLPAAPKADMLEKRHRDTCFTTLPSTLCCRVWPNTPTMKSVRVVFNIIIDVIYKI